MAKKHRFMCMNDTTYRGVMRKPGFMLVTSNPEPYREHPCWREMKALEEVDAEEERAQIQMEMEARRKADLAAQKRKAAAAKKAKMEIEAGKAPNVTVDETSDGGVDKQSSLI